MIRKRKSQGFTLIELLVVVVIIGILASVAIPQFSGAQDKAKNSAVQSSGHTVQMAIEQYGVDNSSVYPSHLDALIGASGSVAYLPDSKLPNNPWGAAYNQTKTDIAASTASVQTSLGAGTLAVPTALTNYSAIAYSLSGSANERYDLSTTGKKGGNAIVIFQTHNY